MLEINFKQGFFRLWIVLLGLWSIVSIAFVHNQISCTDFVLSKDSSKPANDVNPFDKFDYNCHSVIDSNYIFDLILTWFPLFLAVIVCAYIPYKIMSWIIHGFIKKEKEVLGIDE